MDQEKILKLFKRFAGDSIYFNGLKCIPVGFGMTLKRNNVSYYPIEFKIENINDIVDLYDYKFKTVTQPNPHELLFQNESFSSFNPNPDAKIVGSGIFMNNTRVQVRDMTKQTC
jgi:hypothetical protein